MREGTPSGCFCSNCRSRANCCGATRAGQLLATIKETNADLSANGIAAAMGDARVYVYGTAQSGELGLGRLQLSIANPHPVTLSNLSGLALQPGAADVAFASNPFGFPGRRSSSASPHGMQAASPGLGLHRRSRQAAALSSGGDAGDSGVDASAAIVEIYAGDRFSVALASSGALFVWGMLGGSSSETPRLRHVHRHARGVPSKVHVCGRHCVVVTTDGSAVLMANSAAESPILSKLMVPPGTLKQQRQKVGAEIGRQRQLPSQTAVRFAAAPATPQQGLDGGPGMRRQYHENDPLAVDQRVLEESYSDLLSTEPGSAAVPFESGIESLRPEYTAPVSVASDPDLVSDGSDSEKKKPEKQEGDGGDDEQEVEEESVVRSAMDRDEDALRGYAVQLPPSDVDGEAQFIVDAWASELGFFFLADSGRLYSMGANFYGQLSVGPLAEEKDAMVLFPRPVVGLEDVSMEERVVSVASGSTHTLFLTSTGRVFAAGQSMHGAAGLPWHVDRVVPSAKLLPLCSRPRSGGFGASAVPQPRVVISSIAAGDLFSLLVSEDGMLYTVGSNHAGCLGVPPDTVARRTSPAILREEAFRHAVSEAYAFGTSAYFRTRSGEICRLTAMGVHAERCLGRRPVRLFSAGRSHRIVVFEPAGQGTAVSASDPMRDKLLSQSSLFVATRHDDQLFREASAEQHQRQQTIRQNYAERLRQKMTGSSTAASPVWANRPSSVAASTASRKTSGAGFTGVPSLYASSQLMLLPPSMVGKEGVGEEDVAELRWSPLSLCSCEADLKLLCAEYTSMMNAKAPREIFFVSFETDTLDIHRKQEHWRDRLDDLMGSANPFGVLGPYSVESPSAQPPADESPSAQAERDRRSESSAL